MSKISERNEWKDAMLDLFDRLGAESFPYVDKSPKEVEQALYEHVVWLEDRGRGCLAHRIAEEILEKHVDGEFVIRDKREMRP